MGKRKNSDQLLDDAAAALGKAFARMKTENMTSEDIQKSVYIVIAALQKFAREFDDQQN